jgi:hypothetical protein
MKKKKGPSLQQQVWDVLNEHAADGTWVKMNYVQFTNEWRKAQGKGKRAICPVKKKYYIQAKSMYKKQRIELLGEEAAVLPQKEPGFTPKTKVQPQKGDSQAKMIHRYLDTDPTLTFEDFSGWWVAAFKGECPVSKAYFQVCKRKWESNKLKAMALNVGTGKGAEITEAVKNAPLKKLLTPEQEAEMHASSVDHVDHNAAIQANDSAESMYAGVTSESPEEPMDEETRALWAEGNNIPEDVNALQDEVYRLRRENGVVKQLVDTLQDAGERVVAQHDKECTEFLARVDAAELSRGFWKWVALGHEQGFVQRYLDELA